MPFGEEQFVHLGERGSHRTERHSGGDDRRMTGKGEKEQRPGTPGQQGSATGVRRMSFDALRLRARQLSLREQLERHHFLLECTTQQTFSPVWSTGVAQEILRQFTLGVGLVGRAAHEGASQFPHRMPAAPLLPCEENLTVCVPLKLDREVIGVIVILGLLPAKNGLEWVDFELLKFLETYGAVAVQLQQLQTDT